MPKAIIKDAGIEIQDGGQQTFIRYANKNLGQNFSYYKNPTTGKVVGLGKAQAGKLGQNLANIGFVPISATDAFKKPDIGAGNGRIGAAGINDTGAGIDNTDIDIGSSQTIEEIRQREIERKKAIAEQAEILFAPKIQRATQVAEARLGSTRAQLGGARGLGASSAAISFLQQIEKEGEDMIKEVESQKEQFIAQGNFEASERADKAIQDLMDRQLQIKMFNQEMKLKRLGIGLQERQLDITQQNMIFDQAATRAGLTGIFEGKPTIQAKQLELQNQLAEAGVTGIFKGAPTIAGQQLEIQKAQLQQQLQQQPFENQIALFSLLANIPQNQSVTVTLPGMGEQTFSGLKRVVGAGASNGVSVADPTAMAFANRVQQDENFDLVDVPEKYKGAVAMILAGEVPTVNEEDAKQTVKDEIKFNVQVGGSDYETERAKILENPELDISEKEEMLNYINGLEEQEQAELGTAGERVGDIAKRAVAGLFNIGPATADFITDMLGMESITGGLRFDLSGIGGPGQIAPGTEFIK